MASYISICFTAKYVRILNFQHNVERRVFRWEHESLLGNEAETERRSTSFKETNTKEKEITETSLKEFSLQKHSLTVSPK